MIFFPSLSVIHRCLESRAPCSCLNASPMEPETQLQLVLGLSLSLSLLLFCSFAGNRCSLGARGHQGICAPTLPCVREEAVVSCDRRLIVVRIPRSDVRGKGKLANSHAPEQRSASSWPRAQTHSRGIFLHFPLEISHTRGEDGRASCDILRRVIRNNLRPLGDCRRG